jgi:hypothetical protein
LKHFVICFTFTPKRRGEGRIGFFFIFFIFIFLLLKVKWGVGFFLIKISLKKIIKSFFFSFFHSCRWGEGAHGFF